MSFKEKIKKIQEHLKKEKVEGWLLYDFKRSNSFVYELLEIPAHKILTRRFFYWIPIQGDPIKIVPLIESDTLDHLPGIKCYYRTWRELEGFLLSLSRAHAHIAMEYSPYNSLPAISKVDAGTIELIRKGGAQVFSSANLVQHYTSVWSEKQLQSHLKAAEILDLIVEKTWTFIEKKLQSNGDLNEYHVQQFMLHEIEKQGCMTDHPPICGVNANSANPHYSPHELMSTKIGKGDFILLDLWCKQKGEACVYADIARVGVAGPKVSKKQNEVFELVKKARNEGTAFIRKNYEKKQLVQGWEVDQVCREVIVNGGYGDFFIHRTGHNIGVEVHGSGAHLDNYETHDFRLLLPGTCFSMEPGVYLPQEFGMRLEYDIFLELEWKIKITGGVQTEIKYLDV